MLLKLKDRLLLLQKLKILLLLYVHHPLTLMCTAVGPEIADDLPTETLTHPDLPDTVLVAAGAVAEVVVEALFEHAERVDEGAVGDVANSMEFRRVFGLPWREPPLEDPGKVPDLPDWVWKLVTH